MVQRAVPHPCPPLLSALTPIILLSVGPESQKQQVTHYEFIADYHLHPDTAAKGVYVDGCAITNTLLLPLELPCLRSLCRLTSSWCPLLKHFPHGQTVFNRQDNQGSPSTDHSVALDSAAPLSLRLFTTLTLRPASLSATSPATSFLASPSLF